MPTASARSGFVLPAVLVLTGVVAVIFLVAVSALDTLASQTHGVVRDMSFRLRVLSEEARAAFWLATSPLEPAGLSLSRPSRSSGKSEPAASVALDGRYYAAPRQRVLVSFQDEGGLVNVDAVGPEGLGRLFGLFGLPQAASAMMADRLADYMDPDDLKRAAGAEADDYRRAGLVLPPNAPLSRASQLMGLLGWRDLVAPETWSAMRDVITADPTSTSINVNTASPEALRIMFGLDAVQAKAAMHARQIAPFASLEDLGRAAGVGLHGDAERRYTLPNGRLALRILDPVTGEIARVRLVLTPADLERPVWTEEETFALIPPAQRATLPADAPAVPDPTL